MKLYWFWSTNPQKVRWALEELELSYDLVEVDLVKRENKQDWFRAISPRCVVPALELDDVVLWESDAILTYLGENFGSLWPSEPQGKAKAFRLMFLEAAAFQDPASTHFFNRVVLPSIGKEGDSERVAKAAKKLRPILSVLVEELGDQDYILGDFSLVDCAFGPWLSSIDLDDFPTLAAWRDRLRSRPAFLRCDFRY
ncbi:MAG: hypothetical protein CMH54_13955 [Myxococcales bacterium]|nr:hypothetical protein [Myxococcales bacterium]|tara:strand:- start:492 stop:1082 length:591 start_codon:yes stop_codon:yes gene_type:complete